MKDGKEMVIFPVVKVEIRLPVVFEKFDVLYDKNLRLTIPL